MLVDFPGLTEAHSTINHLKALAEKRETELQRLSEIRSEQGQERRRSSVLMELALADKGSVPALISPLQMGFKENELDNVKEQRIARTEEGETVSSSMSPLQIGSDEDKPVQHQPLGLWDQSSSRANGQGEYQGPHLATQHLNTTDHKLSDKASKQRVIDRSTQQPNGASPGCNVSQVVQYQYKPVCCNLYRRTTDGGGGSFS